MKKIIILLLLFACTASHAQQSGDIQAFADSIIKSFTFDLQTEEKGTMMFLDVPYMREGQDSADVLTLTVAKDKNKPRPAFISIIVPSDVDSVNGIFIEFANGEKVDGKWTEKLTGNAVKVPFEKFNGQYRTARIWDGYATDAETKKQVDIFKGFMDNDNVFFLFLYPDGSHKSVGVLLKPFHDQYKKLL
jgi:hypothetical protein